MSVNEAPAPYSSHTISHLPYPPFFSASTTPTQTTLHNHPTTSIQGRNQPPTHLKSKPNQTTMSSKHDEDSIPDGDAKDNTYVSHGTSHIPVQKDEAPIDDPIDPVTADTDEQLGKSPFPPHLTPPPLSSLISPLSPYTRPLRAHTWAEKGEIKKPTHVLKTQQKKTTPKQLTSPTSCAAAAPAAPASPRARTPSPATRRACRRPRTGRAM